ncbi:MAG: ActR/PrrA/RegA family redox response regulator transcription factor [Bosea sp. (in: a-proteobacteria)]
MNFSSGIDASTQTARPTILPDGGQDDSTALSLLLVDEDRSFTQRLARAMELRGFVVSVAETVSEGLALVDAEPPAYVVVDIRLADGNGLDIIAKLKSKRPEARGIVVTGHGSIATAVAAVKLGAHDFIAKPADVGAIEASLRSDGLALPPPPAAPMSAERVRWEHIQRVYEQCGRNVSETARRLSMHRRTLQRILAKRAPR